jgi:hypothetical protein
MKPSTSTSLIFLLLYLLLVINESNNRVPPIPAKIKQFQNKAREVRIKQNTQLRDAAAKKSNEDASASRLAVPRLVHETLPVFELFVRTSGSPWVRYKDILGVDALIQEKASQLRKGGVEAEVVRESVDSWIAVNIFGTGYEVFVTRAEQQ